MSTLNEKEWLIINEITAEIYTKKHINSFAEAFLLLVRRLIPYKAAVFTILHNDIMINEDKVVGVNLTEDDMKEYNNFALVDFTNTILTYPKSMSYRDSNIICREQKLKNDLYRNWCMKRNFEYQGGIMIKIKDEFTAFFTFYKDTSNGDLTDKELYILDTFIIHLENILTDLCAEQTRAVFDYSNIANINLLSTREKELLPYILNGFSNNEISKIFYISDSTVKKHMHSIFLKFNVNGRRELFKYFTMANK